MEFNGRVDDFHRQRLEAATDCGSRGLLGSAEHQQRVPSPTPSPDRGVDRLPPSLSITPLRVGKPGSLHPSRAEAAPNDLLAPRGPSRQS